MEDSMPSYLTKDFIKRALENGFKTSDIEIQDFTVKEASGKGENYTSEIFRVNVNYNLPQQGSQKISLIMKNVQTDGESREPMRNMGIVQIETDMYTKVIPQVEELFGNSIMIAPKCFISDNKASVLVLADLNALGYELQNRLTGLDEEHCKIVMKKIAQYHAGSMHIAKQNPQYADIFNLGIFNKFTMESTHIREIFQILFDQMVTVVKKWSGYEEIVKKLEKIGSDVMKKGVEHCSRKDGELRVINHGDLWVNNMMFKDNNSDKTPIDVAFVDLQVGYYGSLGIDLNYFLTTSVQLEVLKSKRMELLKVYYETFKLSLQQLKYSPIPSWEDVCKEVRAKEFYGLLTLGCVLPIIIMDKTASQNSTYENLKDNSETKHDAMFSSKRMVETLKYSLKRFDELGVLDE